MDWSEVVRLCGRILTIDVLRVWRGSSDACRVALPRSSLGVLQRVMEPASLSVVVGHDHVLTSGSAILLYDRPVRTEATAHSGAICLAYVGKTTREAQRSRRSDEAGQPSRFLASAGVPACCAAHAGQHSMLQRLLQSYRDDQPIPWAMNVSLTTFDCSLLSYVPCSPWCADSRRVAYEGYEILREVQPTLAQQLLSVLCSSTLVMPPFGIAAFRADATEDDSQVCEAIVADGLLSHLIHPGVNVSRDSDGFQVGDIYLRSDSARLFRHA